MLVLSRKIGEQIRIGNGVILTVLEVIGARVRLGIEAPRSIPILREEICTNGQRLPVTSGSRAEADANLQAINK
jgi:carbon storage regulator